MKLWAFGLVLFVVACIGADMTQSGWSVLVLLAAFYAGRIDQKSQDRDAFAWLRRRLAERRRHAHL